MFSIRKVFLYLVVTLAYGIFNPVAAELVLTITDNSDGTFTITGSGTSTCTTDQSSESYFRADNISGNYVGAAYDADKPTPDSSTLAFTINSTPVALATNMLYLDDDPGVGNKDDIRIYYAANTALTTGDILALSGSATYTGTFDFASEGGASTGLATSTPYCGASLRVVAPGLILRSPVPANLTLNTWAFIILFLVALLFLRQKSVYTKIRN